MLTKERQALLERTRPRESGHRHRRELWRGLFQTVAECVARRRPEGKGGVADGTIAGAATEVARHRHRVARTGAIRAILLREETDDEAWRAVAALRSSTGRHRLLDFMQLTAVRQRFDRLNLVPGGHRQKHEAAVHDAIRAPARRFVGFDARHGACAALSLGAPFFRAGEAARPDEIEERRMRSGIVDADGLTIEQELDAAHGSSIR